MIIILNGSPFLDRRETINENIRIDTPFVRLVQNDHRITQPGFDQLRSLAAQYLPLIFSYLVIQEYYIFYISFIYLLLVSFSVFSNAWKHFFSRVPVKLNVFARSVLMILLISKATEVLTLWPPTVLNVEC